MLSMPGRLGSGINDATAMAEVFLSYAREDRALVERLAARLEAAGYRVWWDRHLSGGAAFAREIEQKIEGALAVVVVWTEAAAQSHWVQEEASAGREAGKLVPLRVGRASPPMGFRQLHAIDYAESGGRPDETAIAALLANLERLKATTSGSPPPSAPLPPPAAARSWPRPSAAILAAAVLALVAGLILVKTRSAPVVQTGGALSIAVESRGGDDALAEALAGALARAPWMRVAADETSKARAKYSVTAERKGEGEDARVSARVVDVRTGAIVWSFDASAAGASSRDAALAMQLADAVWRGLYEAEGARLRNAPTTDLTPREYIAKALAGGVYAPWTEQGVREAATALDEALTKRPLDPELLAASAQAEFMLSVIDRSASASLAPKAEEKLAKAVTMAPKSRWVTAVAADVYFATGRYRAAAAAYDRLIEQGYDLPATRARKADSAARLDGAFARAASEIAPLRSGLFSALQRSQVSGALAYMRAAAGADAEALENARLAVAAYPNNPDAIRALLLTSLLSGDDPTLADAARTLCRFYPSYEFPPPERSEAIAADIAGDGGPAWRAFAGRTAKAYAARAAIILDACAGGA